LLAGYYRLCWCGRSEGRMDTDLFDSAEGLQHGEPLASRMRPRTLEEFAGQEHILGPGRLLRRAIQADQLSSLIFYGPPGTGKTTLARVIANTTASHFVSINAVLAGVKEIREATAEADSRRKHHGRRTILFVDEVHRFNKAQQDAFLPHVESGLFTFIGATTENPSFEVNSALLSRATVHVLKALDDADLDLLIERARAALGAPPLTEAARRRLIGHADGDARRLLNAFENLVESLGGRSEALPNEIGEPELEQALGEMLRRYDKGGDQFYDAISALHKSVRGSDPDAALYWLARMLDGGVDPRYVARRVIRMASEDIGLADPRGQQLALQAADVYERLGSPEGELALAQAVVYLAVAPKSNAVYTAWNTVRALVKQDVSRPVPMHLRNAPTRLMKDLGHGSGYRYAHEEASGFAAGEQYLPDGLAGQTFYQPVARGLELRIGERLAELRRLNEAARRGAAPSVPPPSHQG
jgi:putative ATPase